MWTKLEIEKKDVFVKLPLYIIHTYTILWFRTQFFFWEIIIFYLIFSSFRQDFFGGFPTVREYIHKHNTFFRNDASFLSRNLIFSIMFRNERIRYIVFFLYLFVHIFFNLPSKYVDNELNNK